MYTLQKNMYVSMSFLYLGLTLYPTGKESIYMYVVVTVHV